MAKWKEDGSGGIQMATRRPTLKLSLNSLSQPYSEISRTCQYPLAGE
ncbi:hypothetical protein OAJ52_06970 [Bacteroidia bacterium]|nr:hypothetical protein [Bacteroidia bacterium]